MRLRRVGFESVFVAAVSVGVAACGEPGCPDGTVEHEGHCVALSSDDTRDGGSDDTRDGGDVDCELREFHRDDDGDGFGREGSSVEACEPPLGFVAQGGDCDDTHAERHPAGIETCDGIDQDCDGRVDEELDVVTSFVDSDGDGFGDPASAREGCLVVDRVIVGGDCDDDDATRNPDAREVCDGVDQDCDGAVDEGVTREFYRDADGDGYGSAALSPLRLCEQVPGVVARGGDCDDADPTIHPGSTAARAAAVDVNCDGAVTPTRTTTATECRVRGLVCDGDGWEGDVPRCGGAPAMFRTCARSGGTATCVEMSSYIQQTCL